MKSRMSRLSFTLLAFISLSATYKAHGQWQASFACEKAQTATEKMICKDPKLGALDSSLAKEVRNALKNRHEMRAAILASERDWVIKRDRQCASSVDDAKAFRDCLEAQYSARITEMHSIDVFEDEGSQVAALEGDWQGSSRCCTAFRFSIRGHKIKTLGCKWMPFIVFPDTAEPNMIGQPEDGSEQVTAIEIQGATSACPSSVMVFEVYKANSPCSAAWINLYDSRADVGTGRYSGSEFECLSVSMAHR
jgi:uncharacterized protein